MRLKFLMAGIVLVVSFGIWQVQGNAKDEKRSRDQGDPVRRGEYLVNEVAGCTHCHTPHDAKGQPDRSRALQGATLDIAPKHKGQPWTGESVDITASGLGGNWSEEEMVSFLTKGVNPQGEKPIPPMPAFHLHADDARAIAVYLKSLPGSKRQRGEQKK